MLVCGYWISCAIRIDLMGSEVNVPIMVSTLSSVVCGERFRSNNTAVVTNVVEHKEHK